MKLTFGGANLGERPRFERSCYRLLRWNMHTFKRTSDDCTFTKRQDSLFTISIRTRSSMFGDATGTLDNAYRLNIQSHETDLPFRCGMWRRDTPRHVCTMRTIHFVMSWKDTRQVSRICVRPKKMCF